MILDNLVFYIIFFSSAKIILSDQKPKRLITDKDTVTRFINLLKTIVRMNEERVQAIKKVANLQDYLLTRHAEKSEEYYDSVATNKNRATDIRERPVQPVRRLFKENIGQPTDELGKESTPEAVVHCTEYCQNKLIAGCKPLNTCKAQKVKKYKRDCTQICKEIVMITNFF